MIESHSLAELIPSMTPTEYAALRDDIAANGLREPITLYEGKILDGRHRARACEELGREVQTESLNGQDPIAYVISLNLRRRNLTTGQLAAVATSLLDYEKEQAKARQRESGGAHPVRQNSAEPHGKRATTEAGKRVGISRDSVERMRRLEAKEPELAERVKAGELTLNAASEQQRGRPYGKPGGTKQRPAYSLETKKGQQVAATAKLRLERAVGNCSALARSADDFRIDLAAQVSDPEEVDGWLEVFGEARTALTRLCHRIEEVR